MTKPVESAPKLDLVRSMTMVEGAQRLTPGRVGGIRRAYNFVVGDRVLLLWHQRPDPNDVRLQPR